MRMNGGCYSLNVPPLKMDGGGGLDGNEKSRYLAPQISAKTKSPPSAQRSDKNVLEPI